MMPILMDGGGLYLGFNLVSAVGQIAGNYYLSTHARVSDLNNTHGRTLSNKKYNNLKADISQNGIKTPLDVVKYHGFKYVVDGNHRLMIARNLNINIVRVNYVGLPFLGYITPADLFY